MREMLKTILKRLTIAIVAVVMAGSMMPQSISEKIGVEANVQAATTLSNPRIVTATGTQSGQKVTWDCVWFGEYPQREVVAYEKQSGVYGKSWSTSDDYIIDEDLYDALKNATGWDANGDLTYENNRYRKIKYYQATWSTLGGYESHFDWDSSAEVHYFKYEPIKWRVLDIDENSIFLLSDISLDDQQYIDTYSSATWETSEIRSWLNGYGKNENQSEKDFSTKNFIKCAFSTADENAIYVSSVVNNNNRTYSTEGGNDTSDKVFLLSEEETYTSSAIKYGFKSVYPVYDEGRRCKSSTFAKAMGTYTSYSEKYLGNCSWTLRSPGNATNRAAYVYQDGYVYGNGNNINSATWGIRPALNLDLSSSEYSYAGTVCSDGTVNEEATSPGDSNPVNPTNPGSSDYNNILNSINEYDKYQALYYAKNADLITGGYMTYSEIEDCYSPTAYTLNNMLSFAWNKKFGFSDDAKIWEAVLLDILFKRAEDQNLAIDYEKNAKEIGEMLLKYAGKKEMLGLDLNAVIDSDLKANLETVLKEDNFFVKLNTEHDIDILKVMNKLLTAGKTLKEFFKDYANYLSLRKSLDTNIKTFLNQMKYTQTYQNIPAFRRALDEVVLNLTVDDTKLTMYLSLETGRDELIKKSVNEIVGATLKVLFGNAIYQLIDFTKESTIFFMDTVFGTRELSEANVHLYMLYHIDQAAKEAFKTASRECIASAGEKSFRPVNGGLDFIKSIQSYGINVCQKWIGIITTSMMDRSVPSQYVITRKTGYDMTTDYLNLNRLPTAMERRRCIHDKCKEDQEYIDAVLENQSAFARIQWYYEKGLDSKENQCLVLFYIMNPSGRWTVKAKVVPKNTSVIFPEIPEKTGYTLPSHWYSDQNATNIVAPGSLITENSVFYAGYGVKIIYKVKEDGLLKINSVIPDIMSQSNEDIARLSSNITYRIPAYIDGYMVDELGDDIFAGTDQIGTVIVPATVSKISDTAFDSLPEDTVYSYPKGSYADTYFTENEYEHVEEREEIRFQYENVSIRIGEERKLLINHVGDITEEISWESSNDSIVCVDDQGMIKGMASGNAIITASTAHSMIHCCVTVTEKVMEEKADQKIAVSKITLSGSSNKVQEGNKLQLTAHVVPSNATDKTVTWKSSNTAVATVTANGLVSVKTKTGGKTVTISAMANDGSGVVGRWTITSLKKIAVSKITISGISKKIAAGKKVQLTAAIIPSDATNKAVIWKSSDTRIATVTQNGLVTIKAKTGGKKVVITATAADGSGKKAIYKITGMKGSVKSLKLNGKKTMKVKKTQKLKCTIKVTKGKVNKKLKWTSSNTKVATVSATGKVIALKKGKVKITARSTDGTNKKASFTIRVK